MAIKALLVLSILSITWYFLASHGSSRSNAAKKIMLLGFVLLAVVAVLFPDLLTSAAHLLGVGRGADLLLYLWFTISVLLILALYLRLMRLQDQLTELVRQLAIHEHERSREREARP